MPKNHSYNGQFRHGPTDGPLADVVWPLNRVHRRRRAAVARILAANGSRCAAVRSWFADAPLVEGGQDLGAFVLAGLEATRAIISNAGEIKTLFERKYVKLKLQRDMR